MASGESDISFGTDVGKGAPKVLDFFFWPAKGGEKNLPHVSILKMLIFLWRIQMWLKSTKKN